MKYLRIIEPAVIIIFMISMAGATPYAYVSDRGNGAINVIDTTTNANAATIPLDGTTFGVAANSAGTKLYATQGYAGTGVYVIDIATSAVIATVDVGFNAFGVAVSSDGTKVYVTNVENGVVSVIDTASNVVSSFDTGAGQLAGIVSGNGKMYAASGDSIVVINEADNSVSKISTGTVNAGGIAINGVGSKVYAIHTNDLESNTGILSIIDTSSGAVMQTVNLNARPTNIAVRPDGSKIVVVNNGDSSVSVIDGNSYAVTRIEFYDRPFSAAVTPDGNKAFVTAIGAIVNVIDLQSDSNVATISLPEGAITPVGITIVSSSDIIVPDEPTLKINDFTLFTKDVSGDITGWERVCVNTATKERVVYSSGSDSIPKSKIIAVGVYDMTMNVWDDNGNTASKTKEAYLTVAGRGVGFTSVNNGLTVNFTDTCTYGPNVWWWYFGAGESYEQNPTYTFSRAGTYPVIFCSAKDGTQSAIVSGVVRYITVFGPKAQKPVASFTTSVTSGTAPLTVQFTSTSTNDPTRTVWVFGDGKMSNAVNPTHTYTKAGTYTVSLVVGNNAGSSMVTVKKCVTVTNTTPIKPSRRFNR